MEEKSIFRIAIVGSDKRTARLAEALCAKTTIDTVGLIDPNRDPDIYRTAKRLGLIYESDPISFFTSHEVDMALDLSGDPDLRIDLEEIHPGPCSILSGPALNLIEHLAYQGASNVRTARDKTPDHFPQIDNFVVGKSRQIQEVLDLVAQVAPTPTTVLLLGETGTGKDLIARAIHQASPYKDKPYIAINCTALTSSLIESELFGYAKGAFTGAEQDRKGLLEEARGGTIFLDEIGDMQMELQAKMLRFLQTGEIRPVGSNQVKMVKVRIIAATNRHLEEAIAQGQFCRDLYYRFNTFSIKLPPLRERTVDIPYLAYHFLTKAETKLNKRLKDITPEAMEIFMRYEWPGNVRELENAIERAAIVCKDGIIRPENLPIRCRDYVDIDTAEDDRKKPSDFRSLRDRVVADYERKELLNYIHEAGGNISKASRISGIPRRTFYRLMKKYGL